MNTPHALTPQTTLEATSVRRPEVQAQYQHDVLEEKQVFPERRPCAMGKMIRKAREAGLTDPSEPILGDNIYPYVHFADQQVLRHRLLTPSYHVPDIDDLRDIDPLAWEKFYLKQGELRRDGHAIFIHGLGSSAMSVAAHVHAHVFTLGEKISHFDYDQDAHRVRIRAGECWLVDTEDGAPVTAPEAWEPEASVCDHVYQDRFGWA
ncbi:hypothetical protein [Brevibacterium sp. CS2]|uniref:hypothetical protein n=1 Tax=Brevibacterium sp. CS2 TaxID=2575923 RepID=UPI0010C7D0C4|nr:hypothetical protein [Brevibacterium sp. CS2]QCP05008.1 hypothetical protein FDF13_06620 [Brevibacterium sp. CS2]